MRDLANAICSNREENLKRAEIMMNTGRGYLGADAAKLYRELGEEDKCAEYFENHLGKEEEPYEILVFFVKTCEWIEIADTPRNFVRGIVILSAFEVDRTFNKCCCLKLMLMVIFLLSKVIDEVYVFSGSHLDCAGGFSPEFMEVLIRKVCMKFNFMIMVFVSRKIHSLSGDGAEPVIMTIVAFIEDLSAAG